ncbi:MAG: efflux RND transporter permease subunit [Planctomycetes bacterium]|nr:efflux RND transporter permease subunit [Planctomycetota bacterium]
MHFIRFAIQNPVKVSVGVILAVLFGLLAYFGTPVQLTPDVEEPEITVTTLWPGASAQEIEREIVEEQEEQLKSVEGMRELDSVSADSMATITLKFEVGVDLGDAAAKVRDKLNQVPEYPEDADEPVITTVNPNANAIAWFILRPLVPSPEELAVFVERHPRLAPVLQPMIAGDEKIEISVLDKLSVRHPELKALVKGKNDPTRMRKFAQDAIEARFERVRGVANANVLGGQEQEFRVVVDPARLAARNLTIADLHRVLRAENKNTSGGDIWEGKSKNVVRTIGQYTSPQQVADTIVAWREKSPVRVSDVAGVELSYKKPDGTVRQKGVDSIAINAQQAPQTNLIEIMGPPLPELDLDGNGDITQLELTQAKRIWGDSLRIATAELNGGILKQQGLELEQVYDQTDYLNSATSLVQGNIYLGGTLAVLVLLLFLRSWRSVIIIGLAIPISVIATFLFVRGLGRSINVISLAGMAFAVGMVVDNAIVVLENIYRRYQNGEDPETASVRGATEVWGAVVASTATTLAVFIPVIFVQGQAGQLFRDIAIAISCAVGLSLIVSITVIPTAARRILKPHRGRENGRATSAKSATPGVLARVVGFGTRVNDGFAASIDWLQRSRWNLLWRTLIVAGFIGGSLFGAWVLMPQTEYLPEGNRNLVIGILKPPPGYNVEQMISLGKAIEADLAPYWESKPGSPEAKQLAGPRVDNFFFVAREQRMFMGARTVDPLRAGELVPVFQKAASKVPGVFVFASQASLFERNITAGRSIEVEISGRELETLTAEAQQIFGRLIGAFPPHEGHQIQPLQSLDLNAPEVHVVPKGEKASELGMTATELGYAVNALVDGAYAGDYWHDGLKIDLVIYGEDDYARHSQDIRDLPINTPAGKLITVADVADVTLASGPEQVAHSERVRSITLQVGPSPAMALETALDKISTLLDEYQENSPAFRSGQYQIRLAGTADKLSDTRYQLQGSLLLAMLITYLLMAALFESYFYPAIIMTSVLLALVGGFGGLALLNVFMPATNPQKLDMLTMLGFVILIGTVVNNAILIVHQALNHMREEGMEDKAAIVESVRTRVRPIFMTTCTTVLGMLPLVLPLPHFGENGLVWVAGAGSELYRGLGSVVLGGLIVSTVFTLVLVPIGFSLAVDLKKAIARLFGYRPLELVVAEGGLDPRESAPAHAPSTDERRTAVYDPVPEGSNGDEDAESVEAHEDEPAAAGRGR